MGGHEHAKCEGSKRTEASGDYTKELCRRILRAALQPQQSFAAIMAEAAERWVVAIAICTGENSVSINAEFCGKAAQKLQSGSTVQILIGAGNFFCQGKAGGLTPVIQQVLAKRSE